MNRSLTLALVAHDQCKDDLLDWATSNRHALAGFHLVATGTTGHLLGDALGLPVERVRSGPLGGDLQIGASIVEGRIDMLVFFWDPLTARPHEPDVKALLRIAVLRDIPTACNRTTADHLIASHHLLFTRAPGMDSLERSGLPQSRGVPVGVGGRVGSPNGWLAGADMC